jgi:hypothetical protein
LKYKIQFILLLVIPLVLWVLPATFFDTGQSLCLSVLLLNKSCYGCGITRAVQHCMHGDFQVGYQYNHLVVLVVPLLVYLWIKMLLFNWTIIKDSKK